MNRFIVRLIPALVSLGCLTLPGTAQSPSLKRVSQQTESKSPAPSFTLHTYSRMVTLEVVVKDTKGNHVTGLKPEDFQVFEQTPNKSKAKREQKIANFREVSMSDLAVHDSGLTAQIPAGVFTNVGASFQDSTPLTIILVDGLNTDPQYQAQVHVQMLKMLRTLPADLPVAVFLLGNGVRMVQDFTTNSGLLKSALGNLVTPAGIGLATTDPRDDPHSLGRVLEDYQVPVPAEVLEATKEFDQKTFAADMDIRVNRTIDALISIARHVGGYPGRKNLLWISTAFPIALIPVGDHGRYTGDADAGGRNYWGRLQMLNGVLSDAKIAVYPVNPAGVHALKIFDAATPGGMFRDPAAMDVQERESTERDEMAQANEHDSMLTVAEGTGGEVCFGDNDLADCVHKAVDDSSKFYEIAYYPDSTDWNGEYRRITLDTKVKGLHLEYRQGYFANGEPSGTSAGDDLQRAACGGPLDATSIFLAAKRLPPDPKETMKFYLMINPAALTFTASGSGNREVNLRVGVCSFDETGRPLHYMSEGVDQKLTAKEFEILAKSGLPHLVAVAGPKPAAVRLAVMDEASGKVGSVFVKTDGPVIAEATGSSAAQRAPQTKQ